MNTRAIKNNTRQLFNRHFEWMALSAGVIVMALMNPYTTQGPGWCLFERIGIPFCPGDGLGHSIAFIFRGDLSSALEANILGPFALIVILMRITVLLKKIFYDHPRKDDVLK